MIFYKYQRSRPFINLCPGCHRFSIFIFSSKTAGVIETKLNVEPLLDGGMEVCTWDLGHMIKMAAMPVYGKKNFEKLLLRSRKGDDLETWYVPLGIWALPSLFKW